MIGFEQAKLYMINYSGMSRDALHIHISILLFFAALWLSGRKLGSLLPLVIVFGFCIAGEIADILRLARLLQWQQPLENFHDIANTMFWPVAFTAYGRWRSQRPSISPDEPADSDPDA
ncbi:hypothetical protein GCM10009127_01670 [Alteraurantiacibacter aestuarii]|uniref:Uncharacterized protein n=1 Tax=Alteraurantiacibacter aestuarii TaxID=650004 RepID=A0A844ZLD2_9SPHN|nr:hypothetical protein [Alteraurantiacibacter aestuarii]MXO88578.1 hypothetical protein [Alteraurantiacibacter aestuarii]